MLNWIVDNLPILVPVVVGCAFTWYIRKGIRDWVGFRLNGIGFLTGNPQPPSPHAKRPLPLQRQWVANQFRQATPYPGALRKTVGCRCGDYHELRYLYRCLYCGEFFCLKCAEKHFGATRAERNGHDDPQIEGTA